MGVVKVQLQPGNRVTCRNVPVLSPSRRSQVDVPGYGTVAGDVACGGNWFFLVRRTFARLLRAHPAQVEPLTAFTWEIRRALAAAGITGANGAEIDHVELFTAAARPGQPQPQLRSLPRQGL